MYRVTDKSDHKKFRLITFIEQNKKLLPAAISYEQLCEKHI